MAGVSHQTVSRVLNDHPSVRPETRAAVQAAIEALGYRRNIAARALVTRRSAALGVLTSGSALYGPASTLIGIEQAAREAGFFLSLATVPQWDTSEFPSALEHLVGQGVEGVIVVASHVRAVEIVAEFPAPVPVLMVGPTASTGRGIPTVSVDQYEGARLATRHLLSLGFRHVLHVSGPQEWIDAQERLRGWRDELLDANLVPGDAFHADWSAARGYEIGMDLPVGSEPMAIFAGNDELALGLLRAMSERGIDVPSQVSLVGFDDVDGSGFFIPPLTTVRQDFAALGRRCLEVLLTVVGGGEVGSVLVPPQLVVRRSTRSVRSSS